MIIYHQWSTSSDIKLFNRCVRKTVDIPQCTHEHVKEMQQTGPDHANPASGRMSLMRRGVGLQLQ